MKKKVTITLKDLCLPIKYQSPNDNSIPYDEVKNLVINQLQSICTNEEEFRKHITVKKISFMPPDLAQEIELYPGRVVQTIHNEIGIITGICKSQSEDEKPISVVLSGHRIRYYDAEELFQTPATFKEARCIRLNFSREELLWHEGDSAYFFYKNEYYPVVIGKTARGLTKIHVVNNDDIPSPSWEVERESLNRYLVEFINSHERTSYISSDEAINYYRLIVKETKSTPLNRKEQLSIFQRALFALQPRILENANEQLKAFILRNDELYNDTITVLSDDSAATLPRIVVHSHSRLDVKNSHQGITKDDTGYLNVAL